MVLDWGCAEKVLNNRLEDMGGKNWNEESWKLIPQVGKQKNE